MVVALSLSCSGHAVQDTAGPFEDILLRRFWKGDRDCLTSEGRLELGRGTLNLYAALVDYGQAFTQRICFLHVLRGQEAVSYTHLTLPTNREVEISVVAVPLKKKKII